MIESGGSSENISEPASKATTSSVSKVIDAARGYIRRGWYPIPIPRRQKYPIKKEWEKLRINVENAVEHFDENVGIGLLLGSVSGGLVDVDLDCPEAIELADTYLPSTGMVHGRCSKSRSHRWYVVDKPGAIIQIKDPFEKTDRSMIVELRSSEGIEGHQTIVPPSQHPSGEILEWETDTLEPAHVSWNVLVTAVNALGKAVLEQRGHGNDTLLQENDNGHNETLQEGIRNTTLASIAGSLRRRGMTQDEIEKMLKIKNLTSCQPPLPTREVQTIAHSIARYPPETTYHLSDLGNAERLRDEYGYKLRYATTIGWLYWDSKRWRRDNTEEVMRLAESTVRDIWLEVYDAVLSGDKDTRKELERHAKQSESANRIEAMVRLAGTLPSIAIEGEDLDPNPDLLTCGNGTIDLRTGAKHSHDPQDMITRLVSIDYLPEAKCPRWDQFLEEIMDGDAELVRYLKRAIGYSITGKTCEQCLFLLCGDGKNGKSVFLTILEALGGDYSVRASTETFVKRREQSGTNDLARLAGARIVTGVETENEASLAEVTVKQLTGGDRVTCRYLYREHFEYVPQFKLWISSNHRPIVRGQDYAIWRRIRLIPFNRRFDGLAEDRGLLEKLRGELPGIFAQAIAEAKVWYTDGLHTPDRVRIATEEYKEDMDLLADFRAECCIEEQNAICGIRDMVEAYKGYCLAHNIKPRGERWLNQQLEQRFKRGRSAVSRWWKGVRLREVGE